MLKVIFELLSHIFCAICTVQLRFIPTVHFIPVGRGRSVGKATCYGLDGRGSNPGVGEIFRTRPDRPWAPPSLVQNWYRVFSGGKAAGAWRRPSTPSSAEVKERVELYPYFPSGLSWFVLG